MILLDRLIYSKLADRKQEFIDRVQSKEVKKKPVFIINKKKKAAKAEAAGDARLLNSIVDVNDSLVKKGKIGIEM